MRRRNVGKPSADWPVPGKGFLATGTWDRKNLQSRSVPGAESKVGIRRAAASTLLSGLLVLAVNTAHGIESSEELSATFKNPGTDSHPQSQWQRALDNDLVPELYELDTLKAAADQGDLDAHFRLGLAYDSPEFWEPDHDKAFFHLNAAAEGGHPYAKGILGQYYELGWGTEVDKEKAVWLYQDAADFGHYWAGMRLGFMYLDGIGIRQDEALAHFWIKWAADNGVEQAVDWLGWLHELGRGTEQDFEAAAVKYREAIDLGYPNSYASLGRLYEQGHLGPANPEKAAELYRKGVDALSPLAMDYLGSMYRRGRGVEQDFDEAVRLFRKAVAEGRVYARLSLGIAYELGQGVEQDYGTAFEHYKAVVDYDRNASAVAYLGSLYEEGYGVEEDKEKALSLYLEAADGGSAFGQHNAGRMLLNGVAGEAQPNRARRLIRAAAEQGRMSAQVLLGDMYYWSRGVAEDSEEAVHWFRKAYQQDSSAGAFGLAQCYHYGYGVKQDIGKAIEIYEDAIEIADDPDSATGLGDIYADKDLGHYDPERAIAYYRQGHEGGDTDGTYELGAAYMEGVLVERDEKRAKDLFLEASRDGHTRAFAYLGYMAENGLGGLTEIFAAREWYEKAAEGGSRYAMERLVDLYSGKANSNFGFNRDKMQKWQARLADNGHADVAFELAESLSGNAEPADAPKVARFYKVAADAGNLDAAVKWSRVQILGQSGEADFHGGVSMLRQITKSDPLASLRPLSKLIRSSSQDEAAGRSGAERDLFLGIAYQHGIVVPVDPEKAEAHLRKAAPSFPGASYALADLLLEQASGRPDGLNEARSELYFRAYQGYLPAQVRLAQLFQGAHGMERRSDKALYWWQVVGERSATGRLEAARIRLEEGRTGAGWDKVLAVLEDDAEGGVAEAAVFLGGYYAGHADRRDAKLAVRWYEKAARLGAADALIELGRLYKSGKLVDADPAKACAYFRRAVEQGAAEAEVEAAACPDGSK